MAMGRRQHRERQEDLWVAHTQLATSPGHPFYERLNAVLDTEGFDRFVEELCAKFYAPQFGRPSLTPGIYFRSLLIGYFEGIGAERGIAWRMPPLLTGVVSSCRSFPRLRNFTFRFGGISRVSPLKPIFLLFAGLCRTACFPNPFSLRQNPSSSRC